MPDKPIDYRGCKIIMSQSDEGDYNSPFDWDPEPTFISWHRNTRSMYGKLKQGHLIGAVGPACYDHLLEIINTTPECYAWLIQAYIHSGTSLKLGPRLGGSRPAWEQVRDARPTGFDSGLYGVLICQTTDWKSDDEAQTWAEDFVKNWEKWINGDLYHCRIEDQNGNEIEYSSSVYEDFEEIIKGAKEAIDEWYKNGQAAEALQTGDNH